MKSSPLTIKATQKRVTNSRVVAGGVSKKTIKAPGNTLTSPYLKKMKRYLKQGAKSTLLSPVFHTTFKIGVLMIVVSGVMYASYHYIGRSFANEIIVSQSEIIARASKLTALPQENPEEIVRVQDPETLRKQNSFYKDVKEGDYILMYTNLAVIFDLRNNSIIAVKRKDETVPRF